MAALVSCPVCKKKIAADAQRCPKCGHELTEEERTKALKDAKASKIGCLGLLIVAVAIGLAVNSCGDAVDFTGKTPDQMGAEIQKLEDKIQSVKMQKAPNDALVAVLTYLAEPSPSALLMEAPDIKNVLQGIATGKGNGPIGGVTLMLNEPSVDKIGNKGQALAVVLGWNMADLRKVNWDNISEWQILDLSSIMQLGPFGREAISAYCKDSDASYGRGFCRKAGYGQ